MHNLDESNHYFKCGITFVVENHKNQWYNVLKMQIKFHQSDEQI